MLIRFLPWSLTTTFTSHAKNRQETRLASLLISLQPPDVGYEASLLCDVLTAARRRSRGERQLN